MRRPARRPPACFSVRPGKRITMFSPSCLKRSLWPSLKPSPMATISTIEATPHAIPAIVRKLRSLLRNSAETTWVKSSRRKSSMPPLLKNDLLPFVDPPPDLRPGAVADAGGYRHPAPARLRPGVRYLHLGAAILSVNDGAFGNRQHALALFQQDLSVGRHGGHQLARFIGDGNPHFEGGDVVLLHAHGRYLGDLAGEFLVLIGFHRDARPLPQKDLADVALVHLAFDVDLAQVAYRHDQRGATAHGENGADRIARLAVARQHHAVDRRHNGGVAQVFFRSGKLRARLFHLRFGPANRRLHHAQIDHRLLLAVLPQFVILLRFVARHPRGHLLREHLAHPLHIALQERDIRASASTLARSYSACELFNAASAMPSAACACRIRGSRSFWSSSQITCPCRTRSPTFTGSFKMIPEALDLISTLVVGSIFPVATTERARSMRSTFTSFSASIFGGVRLSNRTEKNAATPKTGTSASTNQPRERFFGLAISRSHYLYPRRKAPRLCSVVGQASWPVPPPHRRSVFQSVFITRYVLYPRRFPAHYQDRPPSLSPVCREPADSGLS